MAQRPLILNLLEIELDFLFGFLLLARNAANWRNSMVRQLLVHMAYIYSAQRYLDERLEST